SGHLPSLHSFPTRRSSDLRRPVMTTLVMLGILMFGVMAYRLLPVSNLPNVDFPTIQVNASLPGASPETMASAVVSGLAPGRLARSEEHTSELQSPCNLVCR